MKTISRSVSKFVLPALVAAFVLTGASTLKADEVYYAPHGYRCDNHGYWDGHGHYRHFAYWHNHRGYWDYRGPFRVFITV